LHSVRDIEKFRRRSLFPETPSLKKRAIVPKNFEEMVKKAAFAPASPPFSGSSRMIPWKKQEKRIKPRG
jgi:hypothetical protein